MCKPFVKLNVLVRPEQPPNSKTLFMEQVCVFIMLLRSLVFLIATNSLSNARFVAQLKLYPNPSLLKPR
jgi:hypothetical protein